MIPKIIHYCWFGRNPKNKMIQKCYASWMEFCPEYKIIEWNEDTFDINTNRFVEEAYKAKKWAFVSDYVRLYALENMGGIYLDCDVELIGTLDPMLHHKFFSGFEDDKNLTTGVIGSIASHEWIKSLINIYENKGFIKPNGSSDTTPNTIIMTELAISTYGIHKFNTGIKYCFGDDINIYPWYVFSPKSHLDGKVRINCETIAIHHFSGSWLTGMERIRKIIRELLIKLFGYSSFKKLKSFYLNIKENGFHL